MKYCVAILITLLSIACGSNSASNEISSKTTEVRKTNNSPVQDTSNVKYEIEYHENGTIAKKKSIDRTSGELVFEETFFDNEMLEMSGAYKAAQRVGIWRAFFPTGELQSIRNYNEFGQEEGMSEVYKKEETKHYLYYSGYYSKGERRGTWNFFNESGDIISSKNY